MAERKERKRGGGGPGEVPLVEAEGLVAEEGVDVRRLGRRPLRLVHLIDGEGDGDGKGGARGATNRMAGGPGPLGPHYKSQAVAIQMGDWWCKNFQRQKRPKGPPVPWGGSPRSKRSQLPNWVGWRGSLATFWVPSVKLTSHESNLKTTQTCPPPLRGEGGVIFYVPCVQSSRGLPSGAIVGVTRRGRMASRAHAWWQMMNWNLVARRTWTCSAPGGRGWESESGGEGGPSGPRAGAQGDCPLPPPWASDRRLLGFRWAFSSVARSSSPCRQLGGPEGGPDPPSYPTLPPPGGRGGMG